MTTHTALDDSTATTVRRPRGRTLIVGVAVAAMAVTGLIQTGSAHAGSVDEIADLPALPVELPTVLTDRADGFEPVTPTGDLPQAVGSDTTTQLLLGGGSIALGIGTLIALLTRRRHDALMSPAL